MKRCCGGDWDRIFLKSSQNNPLWDDFWVRPWCEMKRAPVWGMNRKTALELRNANIYSMKVKESEGSWNWTTGSRHRNVPCEDRIYVANYSFGGWRRNLNFFCCCFGWWRVYTWLCSTITPGSTLRNLLRTWYWDSNSSWCSFFLLLFFVFVFG